jgi:hypothetical protein
VRISGIVVPRQLRPRRPPQHQPATPTVPLLGLRDRVAIAPALHIIARRGAASRGTHELDSSSVHTGDLSHIISRVQSELLSRDAAPANSAGMLLRSQLLLIIEASTYY